MLLGELERARACLECTLAFEKTRDGGTETRSRGQTHHQLARVNRALGDRDMALEHAQHAFRILSAQVPASRDAHNAAALVHDLRGG